MRWIIRRFTHRACLHPLQECQEVCHLRPSARTPRASRTARTRATPATPQDTTITAKLGWLRSTRELRARPLRDTLPYHRSRAFPPARARTRTQEEMLVPLRLPGSPPSTEHTNRLVRRHLPRRCTLAPPTPATRTSPPRTISAATAGFHRLRCTMSLGEWQMEVPMGLVPRCCRGLPQDPQFLANRWHQLPPSPSPLRQTCRRVGPATISACARTLRCSGSTSMRASFLIRHRCTTTRYPTRWSGAQRRPAREGSTGMAAEKRPTPTASWGGERKRTRTRTRTGTGLVLFYCGL